MKRLASCVLPCIIGSRSRAAPRLLTTPGETVTQQPTAALRPPTAALRPLPCCSSRADDGIAVAGQGAVGRRRLQLCPHSDLVPLCCERAISCARVGVKSLNLTGLAGQGGNQKARGARAGAGAGTYITKAGAAAAAAAAAGAVLGRSGRATAKVAGQRQSHRLS